MKWLFCGAGVVLLATLLFAGHKMRNARSTDDMDGGVVKHRSGDDAPKVIESTEIAEFHCEFSLLAAAEPGELDNCIYRLDALRKEDAVHCTYERYGRGAPSEKAAFETDASFLESLHEIVSRHDLAAHNGYVHTVSGLPDKYGVLLDIRYASGESIYAHNNQSCFLAMDAMRDLNALFRTQIEEPTIKQEE